MAILSSSFRSFAVPGRCCAQSPAWRTCFLWGGSRKREAEWEEVPSEFSSDDAGSGFCRFGEDFSSWREFQRRLRKHSEFWQRVGEVRDALSSKRTLCTLRELKIVGDEGEKGGGLESQPAGLSLSGLRETKRPSSQREVSAPQEVSEEEEPPWYTESKPGGPLHLKALKRLYFLSARNSQRDKLGFPAGSETAVSNSGFSERSASEEFAEAERSTPSESGGFVSEASETSSSAASWNVETGFPIFQHRSAASRKRVSSAVVGDLVRQKCNHAIRLFENEFRKLSDAEVREVELRTFVCLLVSHLSSVETRSILKTFCMRHLNTLSFSDLRDLLALLTLGEDETKRTAADAPFSQEGRGRRSCCCLVGDNAIVDGYTCDFKGRAPQKAPVDASISKAGEKCICFSACLVKDSTGLLSLIRGEPQSVPPCLRHNQALKKLLTFVHKQHPLLASMQSVRTPEERSAAESQAPLPC